MPVPEGLCRRWTMPPSVRNFFFYRFDPPGLPGGIRVGIAESGRLLTDLFFENHVPAGFRKAVTVEAETPLIKEAARQVGEYLAGKRRVFDVPVELAGTDFQKDVWRALLAVPFGATKSYKEIAADVGRPKAVRAVGLANNRNPVSIIVPCHRVIGHDGSLTGYGGGLPVKRFLLELEAGRLI